MRRLFSFAFWIVMFGVCALKIAEWTSENWWMNSLGFGGAQLAYWKWRVCAFVPAFGLWAVVMGLNARLAWHNAHWRDVSLPLLGPRALAGRGLIPPEDRARLDILARRSSRAFILLGALLCGVASANHFDLWVLALRGGNWGVREAASGQDIGFFVWVLPALGWAWNALGTLLLFCLGLVAAIAAFEGVLDFDTRGLRVGEATARHLAFLGALLLGWIGARTGLSMLWAPVNLGWSPNGIYGFYDRTFTQPTRVVFLLSSLPLALWFARAANRRFRRAWLIACAWSLCALLFPLMAPSFGRATWPSSPSLDAVTRGEIQSHIDTTRRAWDLEGVQSRALKVAATDFLASPEGASAPPLPVVAWPEDALRHALDRNNIDSNRQPGDLFIAREGERLVARVVEVNPSVTQETSALALASDPSKAGTVAAKRETFAAVVMAPADAGRAVPLGPDSVALAPLPGDDVALAPAARLRQTNSGAGVARHNALQGLALALRFGNGSLLETGPPVTWHLDPLERVETLAPMVFWQGARPHPAWVRVPGDAQAHLFWLIEGCFASRSFPGAAMAFLADEWSGITYARQSVLGVCDATTGQSQFFLFDPDEPFARAWNALLPGFFRPASELPAPLRAATRLSRPLVAAQSVMWTRYHPAPAGTDEALEWTRRSDEWRALPPDTSRRERFDQSVLIRFGGRTGLESLVTFAPFTGTSASVEAGALQTTPVIALLSSSDEGDDLWRGRGHARRISWRAPSALALPVAQGLVRSAFVSPLGVETWQKTALSPELDAKGDIAGLSLSRGEASPLKDTASQTQWTLLQRVSSTQPARLDDPVTPLAGPTLSRAKTLWSAWKTARAGGRWARVEELERELNRLLAP